MERSLKELNERKTELEDRVRKLEVENRFLKDLLTEKEGNRRERDRTSTSAGKDKGRARGTGGTNWGVGVVFEDDEIRELDDRKDGVGT
jgi:cell shape-determining protein MreC